MVKPRPTRQGAPEQLKITFSGLTSPDIGCNLAHHIKTAETFLAPENSPSPRGLAKIPERPSQCLIPRRLLFLPIGLPTCTTCHDLLFKRFIFVHPCLKLTIFANLRIRPMATTRLTVTSPSPLRDKRDAHSPFREGSDALFPFGEKRDALFPFGEGSDALYAGSVFRFSPSKTSFIRSILWFLSFFHILFRVSTKIIARVRMRCNRKMRLRCGTNPIRHSHPIQPSPIRVKEPNHSSTPKKFNEGGSPMAK